MDLINALPGNRPINTVQHTTIEEAVFSMSAVMTHSGGWWSCDVFPVMHVRPMAICYQELTRPWTKQILPLIQPRNGHTPQETCHVTTTHRYVMSPQTWKKQPPILLRVGQCLQSCCQTMHWSNPLQCTVYIYTQIKVFSNGDFC
jgi:hypothetical protein